MARDKLTDLKVKALNKPGRYGDGGGLWLQVREPSQEDAAPNKSWLFRYTLHGRQRQMGLGPYGDVGLKDARNAAAEARRALLAGTDPIGEKHAKKAAQAAAAAALMTFKDVAELYLAAHEKTWRNPKHRWQWRQTLEAYCYPVFGKWPVAAVDTGAIMKVLEPIWYAMPETATRLRGRIETVLDYATARSWRTGDNPARWRGLISNLLPTRNQVAKVEHHAALPWKEIGAFVTAVEAQSGTAAKALRFTILTAARTTEALEARWCEIDMDTAVWTVPPERMKAGREHRVPLAEPVLALLREMRPNPVQPEAPLFPGAKEKSPLSNTAMIMLLRRMKRGELTVHGFRSTFRDWCGESTNHPRELAEAALAHSLKSKTEAAYSRGDALEKRRRLMEDWATFCGRPAETGGDVVPIRRQA
jgi:integrase